MTTTRYRLNYRAPNFLVENVFLTFQLDKRLTYVTSRFTLSKNRATSLNDFQLDGSDSLSLISLSINGELIEKDKIVFENDAIIFTDLADQTVIEIQNTISPEQNSRLQGIFITDGFFCSDCEPQGFRHITYFPDRPDIMTTYTVKLIADKSYSALLSNGNLVESGNMENNQHYAIWHDPFPKPTYLFAVVSGDLEFIEDQYIRSNGTPVQLRIYAKKSIIQQCYFALTSLKRAMKWDEIRFDLHCDLDFYNIVAVNDFNGGAMENKGLNIFNAQYILADQKTATDHDFNTVEAVIAHEYFHNWTGNRITCRDWFNLSLKEGLTVFREQEFTADSHHRGIKRIEDIKLLRAHQFTEDAGPLAHPVRPDQCEKVENFYTTTIYEKGAEVIRLYQTLLGRDGFNRGIKHYIDNYDGKAVTTDEFLHSMEISNQKYLANFDRWYSQAGTPHVYASTEYIPNTQTYALSLRQVLPNSQMQKNKLPQPIPIKYAFLSTTGKIELEAMTILDEETQTLHFQNITEEPIISLLRDFSAPIIMHYDYSLEELITILQYETDAFAKWEALQKISESILLNNETLDQKKNVIARVFAPLFMDTKNEPELSALLFTLPEINTLLSKMPVANADSIYQTKSAIEKHLAKHFHDQWHELYHNFQTDNSKHRAIKNRALYYISLLTEEASLIYNHYYKAINMTDREAALNCAIQQNLPFKIELLDHFYNEYCIYPTVIDKWFSLQARNPNLTLNELEALINHPDFSYTNPNRTRAVIGTFGHNNVVLQKDIQQYYAWLTKNIMNVDAINPQTAARLIGPFSRIQNLSEKNQKIIKSLLHDMTACHSLSSNLKEQISRIL